MSDIPACKDCRYFMPARWVDPRCLHPRSEMHEHDVINGRTIVTHPTCIFARGMDSPLAYINYDDFRGACYSGRLFEPKDTR